jgi:ABC-2 type transport system ATP-binding protein
MGEPAIAIDRMTKIFKGWRHSVTAVSDLSLTVEPGTVVAFVGPNGAGKTTTIYMLLGLLAPQRGSVRIFGQPAGSVAARRGIGFLSEIFYTYPYRTARRVMGLYGSLSGVPADTLARRIPDVLSRVGLEDAVDRKVGTFSKGMIQRLGLAQALLHQPPLLILDEPTTGLDPEGRRLVVNLIVQERARGTTVFLSSHILSDVERTGDHVVMIRRGRVVLSAALAELMAGSDDWEVEITGWQPRFAADLAHAGYAFASETAGVAVVKCSTPDKDALLRLALDLGLGIGAVRHGRRSLEELYMTHVGEEARDA